MRARGRLWALAGFRLWALGSGLWALGSGLWALGFGLWALGAGGALGSRGLWALGSPGFELLALGASGMVWVKICGITSPADAVAAADAGADAIGMLSAPSTRRVSIENGRQIARALPPHVERVGLFYDESASIIEETAEAVGLTAVQLHADESSDFAAGLFRANGRRSRVRVFKTIHIARTGGRTLLPAFDTTSLTRSCWTRLRRTLSPAS